MGELESVYHFQLKETKGLYEIKINVSVLRGKQYTQMKIKMGKTIGLNSSTDHLSVQRQISNMIIDKESFGSCIHDLCILQV